MTIRNYADLLAWQKAMDLTEAVYTETSALPQEERYGLTSQLRRAAVSIPSNIAEGKGRRTDGEFLNHLSVAHGSICELETQVLLTGRLGLLKRESVDALIDRCAEVGRLVNGLANSIGR